MIYLDIVLPYENIERLNHRISEYPDLEEIHDGHWVQLLAPQKTTQKSNLISLLRIRKRKEEKEKGMGKRKGKGNNQKDKLKSTAAEVITAQLL